jgi:histidine triad (HIT) family protein
MNIFTKIVNKEIPADIILEDIYTCVIRDIQPKAKIHLLIIPKKNYIDYVDFLSHSSQEEKKSMETMILAIIQKFNLSNSKLITNSGKEAFQEIFHFHIHFLSY